MKLLKPAKNRVLLRRLDVSETEQPLVVVPEHLQEKPDVYQVMAIGQICDDNWKPIDPDFAMNDLVIIDRSQAVDVEIGCVKYTTVYWPAILMVVDFTTESVVNN